MVLALAAGSLVAPKSHRPAIEVNEWVVRNVVRWLPLIHQWHAEYPNLDPAFILAIIGQESMGQADVIGSDRVGSVGLCQIAPFPWRATQGELLNPSVNISFCMSILDQLMDRYRGDLRMSLAVFNCGEVGISNNRCGRFGGFKYANVVINHWLPIFRQELRKVASGNHDLAEWMEQYHPKDSVREWLMGLSYDHRLGKWHRRESVLAKIRMSRYWRMLR